VLIKFFIQINCLAKLKKSIHEMIFDKIKLVKFVFLTWQNNVFKELQANLVKG